MRTDLSYQRAIAIGGSVIAFLAALAILGPVLSPYDPNAVKLTEILAKPTASHWMGTDFLGRDVLTRMLYAARISLLIGFIAVGISTVVGTTLGALAGYFSKLDRWIMGFVDLMLCFPTFFLILAVIAFLEANIWNIMVVIGLTSWMGVARLMRAEILTLKQREFVLAARVAGAKDFHILRKHLIPNAMGPVLVNATLGVGAAILVESGLSFLGIGVQPPTATWGNMLMEGKQSLGLAWWLSVYPGLAILVTVIGFNLLGEGLRDYVLGEYD
ncbi:MAG: ABC transporter permease [Candidatus Omnitrophica bacterium]|nr:ABC transporter permease [Candidatus Omnitrophota bacterium]